MRGFNKCITGIKQRSLGSLDDMLNDINIDREKVLNKLENLQVNKAPGVDGIARSY